MLEDILVSRKLQFNDKKYFKDGDSRTLKILDSSNNKLSLLISESLYIKKLCPTLNSDISSVPLSLYTVA